VKRSSDGDVGAVAWESRPVDSEPVRRGRGRPRLPHLRLAAPETVAITTDQYRQAVDLLASMMLDHHHAQHQTAVRPDEQPPTPG
jgi:hypothetical protein